MKTHSLLFWIFLFGVTVARTMTDLEVGERKHAMAQATPNPSFIWKTPFALHVVFPDGQEDYINLEPVRVSGEPVKCLFRGQFYRDPSSSAVISGCMEDDVVTITIVAKELWGRTAFEVSGGLVEEVENPYIGDLDEDYGADEDEDYRVKRSVYEDYQDYDYTDVQYDGGVNFSDPPPLLTTPVRLAFDRSFKDKMGSEEAAKTYVRTVAELGSVYLKNFSPKTKIFLNFVDEIEFINETLVPNAASLHKAFELKKPEAVPMVIFCATDDSNKLMGISPGIYGKACHHQKGVSIVKHRSKKALAAMTVSHELGHVHGMKHDHRENATCHGRGLMSEVRPDLLPNQRPTVFSSCSIARFTKWYHRHGFECMEEGIVNKDSKLKYLDEKCSSLVASPGETLQSGCQKPEQLKDGAWMCSEDGGVCHLNCQPGFRVVHSNKKTFTTCFHQKWFENPNGFLCEIDPDYRAPRSILIESSGRAVEYQGGSIGYFDESSEKLNQRPVYIQRGGNRFLYYHGDNGEWYVGKTLGTDSGRKFRIKSDDQLPPSTGWSYYGGGKWNEAAGNDDTLKVTIDPPELTGCDNIQVQSTGPAGTVQSEFMGLYKQMAGQWFNGRRVYHNGYAYLRVKTKGTTWTVGLEKDISGSWIQSGRATLCPCREESGPSIRWEREWWVYWDGNKWVVDESITVTCV